MAGRVHTGSLTPAVALAERRTATPWGQGLSPLAARPAGEGQKGA